MVDCGRSAFERMTFRRSQLESGTSCQGSAFLSSFLPLGSAPTKKLGVQQPLPSPPNEKRGASLFTGKRVPHRLTN